MPTLTVDRCYEQYGAGDSVTGAAKVVVTVPQKTDDMAMQNSAAEASAIDCKPWGCCCDGYADYFGGIAGKCMGCAPGNVSRWWGDNKCNTIAASGKCCDGPFCKQPGAPACTPPPSTGPVTVPSWKPSWRMDESTVAMPCDYLGYVSDMPGWKETTGKFALVDIDCEGRELHALSLSRICRSLTKDRLILPGSNNKKNWANSPGPDGRGMSCEEDMVKQADAIKAADPSKRVWIYRNIVNA